MYLVPSTYIRFSEIPPLSKKFRDAYDAYFEKIIRGWKEKTQHKLNIKDQCFLHSYIYNDNTNIYMFRKKNVKLKKQKKYLRLFNKKIPLCAGLDYPLRNICSSQKNLFCLKPIVWNSLPTKDLKLANSVNNFKHKLKDHLFKKPRNMEQGILAYWRCIRNLNCNIFN